MFRRKFLTAAIVAAVALLASPAVSQAGFAVRIERLSAGGAVLDSLTVYNEDPNDGAPAPLGANSILFADTSLFGITGLDFTVTATRTESGLLSILTENNATVLNTSGSAHRLRVSSTSTYDLPNGQPNLELEARTSFLSANAGLTFPNIGYRAYFDKNGDDFGTDVPITTVTAPSAVAMGGGGVIADPGVTWALTQTLDFTVLNNGTVVQLDGTILVTPTSDAPTLDVPAPAGLIMALGVVPFFGVLRRRLRKTEPAAA